MNEVYVTGHRNPDTDSICSAIGYARLKQEENPDTRYIPCRLGPTNPQTTWVLEQAGVPAPVFLSDVHVRVRDLMTRDVISVPSDSPLLAAVQRMQEDQVRLVPVVDGHNRPTGMITSFSLTDHLLQVTAPSARLQATVTRENLVAVLQADVLSGQTDAVPREVAFLVAVMGTFSFSKELGRQEPNQLVLFTADRNDIIRTAIEHHVGVVIVTGGCRPSDEAITEAQRNGVTLMVTNFPITQALNRAKLAIPSGLAAETGAVTIREDVLRADARRRLVMTYHRGMMVVNEDEEVVGILTRSDLLKDVRKSVILVDHNEAAQSVPGLYDARILEVVDHHRIGNFSTDRPISYLCRPTGSTCAIVAGMYRERGRTPDPATARLLLSGILSDTVLFRSPTCTPEDEEMAAWLAELGGLDLSGYGMEMFRNTSQVAKRSDRELVEQDRKIFTEGSIRFSVSQIEVVGFEEVRERLSGLRDALEGVCQKEGLLFAQLMVTDIVAGDSLILHAGDLRVIRETGFPERGTGEYLAGHLISRKKQLLPRLLAIVKELDRDPV